MKRLDGCTIAVVLLISSCSWACGSDGGSGNSGSGGTSGTSITAGTLTSSGTATTNGGGTTSTGSTTGSTQADWTHCGARAPDSDCTVEATCAYTRCGDATSSLDDNGCVRTTCTSDAACGAGEVCFPGWIVYTAADAGNFRTCGLNDSEDCVCFGKGIGEGGDAYCVAEASVTAIQGCFLHGVVAASCATLGPWLAAAEAAASSLQLSSAPATLVGTCLGEAQAQHTALGCD